MKQKITRPVSIRIKYTRYVIPILLITFLSIGEQDTRTDVEGVDLTVLADIPALSQTTLKTVCGDVDETLVQHFLRVHLAGI